MRDAEKTIGDIIDKSTVTVISSIDNDGFPNTKAMLPPRKRTGIKEIYLTTNTKRSNMKNRKLFNILERQVCYFCIFLFLLNHWGFSQSKNVVQPIIGVAPLWIMAEYGLYWGVSLSGGIEILKHHTVLASADLAPVGLLGMTDVYTEGKERHWGGTLSYLFTIRLCDNFVRFEPGAALGISSIPYIYGTLSSAYIDSTLSTNSTSNERPERETILGVGPEFRFSIGRNRLQIFLDGRVLFAKNYNTAFMTNAGVSFEL